MLSLCFVGIGVLGGIVAALGFAGIKPGVFDDDQLLNILMSFVMAFWSVLFVSFWKRKNVSLGELCFYYY